MADPYSTEGNEERDVVLRVRVSHETIAALATMAREQHKDIPVLVRDATAVAYAIHKELLAGGEVIVERRRGRRVALIFDWFTGNAEPHAAIRRR